MGRHTANEEHFLLPIPQCRAHTEGREEGAGGQARPFPMERKQRVHQRAPVSRSTIGGDNEITNNEGREDRSGNIDVLCGKEMEDVLV